MSLLETAYAQTTYKIASYGKTQEAFSYLLLANNAISVNDTINEKIIDLVIPSLADSIIERKKQHHKVGGLGWFIHAFGGLNWRAIATKKEKFVGTIVAQSRSGEEQFTEYDVNFDLNFHLPKYLNRVFTAYDLQGKIKRQDITTKHKTDYKAPPFVRDTNNIDIRNYRLHCELTPMRNFRPQLNYQFYPTLPGGGGLKGHPNFENDNPSVGFYGVFCLDCNHTCHPEIHPYEWMWWLKCNDKDSSTVKEWHVGIFHESSNRQKKWSINPMTGTICLPFAFKVGQPETVIEIEHRVMNQFVEDGLSKAGFAAAAIKPNANQWLTLEGEGGFSTKIELRFVNTINTEGLKYWLSGLNYDAESKVVSGYLYYAVSVMDLYTCKIRFK